MAAASRASTTATAAVTAAATATAAAAGKSTISKAVHLRIYPHPRNLRESREVLRVLQRYGVVEMFKSLRVGHFIPQPSRFFFFFLLYRFMLRTEFLKFRLTNFSLTTTVPHQIVLWPYIETASRPRNFAVRRRYALRLRRLIIVAISIDIVRRRSSSNSSMLKAVTARTKKTLNLPA